MKKYAIGLDYGTNSCRCVIVDLADGSEIGGCIFPYPSGEDGILLDPKDPNLARQNPQDYIDAFSTITESIKQARKVDSGFDPANIVGIGVDTTGSTPMPVDKNGIPLGVLGDGVAVEGPHKPCRGGGNYGARGQDTAAISC